MTEQKYPYAIVYDGVNEPVVDWDGYWYDPDEYTFEDYDESEEEE